MNLIDIEITDIDLCSTIEQFKNMKFDPFLKDAGQLVHTRIVERLRRGEGPDGPLPENVGLYADWKAKRFPGAPPLTLYGDMQKHIIEQMSADEVVITMGPGNHRWIPNGPKWLTQDPRGWTEIAAGHEAGARGEKRVFLAMNDRDIADTLGLFAKIFQPEFE